MTDANKWEPADVEALIARLGTMSWKGTRHRFDIGDYWNICEEAEEALRALAEELTALKAQVSKHDAKCLGERYTSPVAPPAAANAVPESHDELALLRRSISAQLLFLFDRNCRVVGNTLELPFDSHDHAFTQLMQARQLCEILSARQETPR
ncbi:MAG: hypothetical protein ACOY9J_08640 [Pseudomonadota bacterium]